MSSAAVPERTDFMQNPELKTPSLKGNLADSHSPPGILHSSGSQEECPHSRAFRAAVNGVNLKAFPTPHPAVSRQVETSLAQGASQNFGPAFTEPLVPAARCWLLASQGFTGYPSQPWPSGRRGTCPGLHPLRGNHRKNTELRASG